MGVFKMSKLQEANKKIEESVVGAMAVWMIRHGNREIKRANKNSHHL